MNRKRLTAIITLCALLLGIIGTGVSADQGKMQTKIDLKVAKNGSVQMKLSFRDMKEAVWALRHVTKMMAQNIIAGYQDGSFRPNKAVNHAEAVVMAMRSAGVDTVSSAVYLPFKDADKIPVWARTAVSEAAKMGYIESGDTVAFEASKAASRGWVTKLVVKTKGLEDKVAELANVQLPFKDASAIPEDLVGYIAVALQQNIVSGFPNGNFMPNKPVTRAQIAVMLGQAESQDITNKNARVEGTVINKTVAANVYGGETKSATITLQTKKNDNSDDGNVTYPVNKDAVIYINETTAQFDDIKIGSRATLVWNNDHTSIIYIEIEPVKVKGIISLVSPETITIKGERGQADQEFQVNSDTIVTLNGKRVIISDLTPGLFVAMVVENNTATEIKVMTFQKKLQVMKKEVKLVHDMKKSEMAKKQQNKMERQNKTIPSKIGHK